MRVNENAFQALTAVPGLINDSYYHSESCLNSLFCCVSEVLICNSNLLTFIQLPRPKHYLTTHMYLWDQKAPCKLYIQPRTHNQACVGHPRHQWHWKSTRSKELLTYSNLLILQWSKLGPRKMKNHLPSHHYFQGLLIDRPGSGLRLRAKRPDSDCTILAPCQAALWNSTSIS